MRIPSRTTGNSIGVEPLVRRWRWRVRLDRAVSERLEYRFRRFLRWTDDTLRSPHGPGTQYQSLPKQSDGCRRRRLEVQVSMELPDRLFTTRSEHAVRRRKRFIQVDRRGQQLANYQSGSDAQRQNKAGTRRVVQSRRTTPASNTTRRSLR